MHLFKALIDQCQTCLNLVFLYVRGVLLLAAEQATRGWSVHHVSFSMIQTCTEKSCGDFLHHSSLYSHKHGLPHSVGSSYVRLFSSLRVTPETVSSHFS